MSCYSHVLPPVPHSPCFNPILHSPYPTLHNIILLACSLFVLHSPHPTVHNNYSLLSIIHTLLPSFPLYSSFTTLQSVSVLSAFLLLHTSYCIHYVLPSIPFIPTVHSVSKLILHTVHCILHAPFTTFSPILQCLPLYSVSIHLYICVFQYIVLH